MEKPNQSPDAIPNGYISEKIIHSLADIGGDVRKLVDVQIYRNRLLVS